jgi:Cupin-like domain
VKLFNKVKEVDDAYWAGFGDVAVPLEKLTKVPGEKVVFERFEAPLFVFMAWNKRKIEGRGEYEPHTSLYLAQYSVTDLPKELQRDLPQPELVRECGASVYASNLWMGVPPTDTPLHRDPNPNFFVQLAGRKKVRLIKPWDGDLAYTTVRSICAEEEGTPHFDGSFKGGNFAGFSANMRGDEMMLGLEKKIMDSLIWEDEHNLWTNNTKDGKEKKIKSEEFLWTTSDGEGNDTSVPLFKGFEVELGPGDGCFIPTGWWHSLRGVEEEIPGINASVNWWFRPGKPDKATREMSSRRGNSPTRV